MVILIVLHQANWRRMSMLGDRLNGLEDLQHHLTWTNGLRKAPLLKLHLCEHLCLKRGDLTRNGMCFCIIMHTMKSTVVQRGEYVTVFLCIAPGLGELRMKEDRNATVSESRFHFVFNTV